MFDYARLQTDTALRALGREELDAARQGEILADPGAARLAPARSRKVVAARVRPRDDGGRMRDDWIGTLQTLDGQYVHFLVAGAPVQPDGQRRVDIGDYLRVDGLFHCVYRAAVEGEPVAAPLVLGANLVPSTAPMTPRPRVSPQRSRPSRTTASARSSSRPSSSRPSGNSWDAPSSWARRSTGTPRPNSTRRRSPRSTRTARATAAPVPRARVHQHGHLLEAHRRQPAAHRSQTEGWIGNSTWKGSVKTIKWFSPFTRQDMLREGLDDDHRYVVGKGSFFRNHVFMNKDGQPIRAPIFVMDAVDVFVPEEDPTIAWFKWGVLGGTIVLTLGLALCAPIGASRRRSTRT